MALSQSQSIQASVDPSVLKADLYEKALAVSAIVLLGAVATALVRGRSEWMEIPPLVWAHLGTVMLPVAITPIQLLRRRGDPLHRALGWIWSVSLFATAVVTFGIRDINQGALSWIHIFSVVTLVSVPLLVAAARFHNIGRHRGIVRGLTTGALLTAGFFTLLPDRMLGRWLFG